MNNLPGLRDYQSRLYNAARDAIATHRSCCVQLATGAGKTPLISAMCNSVYGKNKIVWVLVNRKELIDQTSEHLKKWNVPHNKIIPGNSESLAFNVHICSSDTLIKRMEKIKRLPDLLIVDECHLMLQRQKDIISYLPDETKIVGFTATPERYSGEGLSSQSGGVYDELIEGPSIPELTRGGYLCELKYYAPPLEGLDEIKINRFGEFDSETLDELLRRKKVYGQVVDHYIRHGTGRPALIFCRSIKSAEHTAQCFRDKGFQFYNIDSTMSDGRRVELIQGILTGKIQGLTGVDIFSYGVNLPNVSYSAMLRPTLSKSIYFQCIGRSLRVYPGKTDALFFDHVNNILNFQEEGYPGIPPHFVPHIEWRFHGTEKNKRAKKENNIMLCVYRDFLYCENPHCSTCPHNPDHRVADARRPMVVVPAELEEIPRPVALAEREPEERRKIEDRIGELVLEYRREPAPGPVEELIRISEECGYDVLWVYYALIDRNRKAINVPLLHEMARLKGYKPGKVFYWMREIRVKKEAV